MIRIKITWHGKIIEVEIPAEVNTSVEYLLGDKVLVTDTIIRLVKALIEEVKS